MMKKSVKNTEKPQIKEDPKTAINAKNAEKAEIGIIIGPEGGFSDSEAEYAESLGINFVGLGNRILRTETVSCAMLGMVMYELGEI